MRKFSGTFGGDCNREKVENSSSHPNQIPHLYPHSQSSVSRQNPQQMGQQKFFPSMPTNTQSLSQSSCFSFDSLPLLSPSPLRDSSSSNFVFNDVLMEEWSDKFHSLLLSSSFESGNGSDLMVGEILPPRKTHKRSITDIPLGFSSLMQSSSPIVLGRGSASLDRPVTPSEKQVQLVRSESSWERGSDNGLEELAERKTEEEVDDDLFSGYLNFDNFDAFYSSDLHGKKSIEHLEVLDSRESGTKLTDNNNNAVKSSNSKCGSDICTNIMSTSSTKRKGIEKSAEDDLPPTMKHYRSTSVDCSIGNLKFIDKSSQMPSSSGPSLGQLSLSNSMDGNTTKFRLQSSNQNFSEAELTKIMADEKLVEIALNNPKRAKRILANRQSAARSKEKKTRYLLEIEQKVQSLQTKATALSTELTFLQKDVASLTNQNNKIKFYLQVKEQEVKLQEDLNEALYVEIQHMKLTSIEMSRESTNDIISGP